MIGDTHCRHTNSIARDFYRQNKRVPSDDDLAIWLESQMQPRLNRKSYRVYRSNLAKTANLSAEAISFLYNNNSEDRQHAFEVDTSKYIEKAALSSAHEKDIESIVSALTDSQYQHKNTAYYHRAADIIQVIAATGVTINEIINPSASCHTGANNLAQYITVDTTHANLKYLINIFGIKSSPVKQITKRTIPVGQTNKRAAQILPKLLENFGDIRRELPESGDALISASIRQSLYRAVSQPKIKALTRPESVKVSPTSTRNHYALMMDHNFEKSGFTACERVILVRALLGVCPINTKHHQILLPSKSRGGSHKEDLAKLFPNKPKMFDYLSKIYGIPFNL